MILSIRRHLRAYPGQFVLFFHFALFILLVVLGLREAAALSAFPIGLAWQKEQIVSTLRLKQGRWFWGLVLPLLFVGLLLVPSWFLVLSGVLFCSLGIFVVMFGQMLHLKRFSILFGLSARSFELWERFPRLVPMLIFFLWFGLRNAALFLSFKNVQEIFSSSLDIRDAFYRWTWAHVQILDWPRGLSYSIAGVWVMSLFSMGARVFQRGRAFELGWSLTTLFCTEIFSFVLFRELNVFLLGVPVLSMLLGGFLWRQMHSLTAPLEKTILQTPVLTQPPPLPPPSPGPPPLPPKISNKR